SSLFNRSRNRFSASSDMVRYPLPGDDAAVAAGAAALSAARCAAAPGATRARPAALATTARVGRDAPERTADREPALGRESGDLHAGQPPEGVFVLGAEGDELCFAQVELGRRLRPIVLHLLPELFVGAQAVKQLFQGLF